MANPVIPTAPFGAAFLETATPETLLGGAGVYVRPNVTSGDYVQIVFDGHGVASMGTYQGYTPFGGLQVDWSIN